MTASIRVAACRVVRLALLTACLALLLGHAPGGAVADHEAGAGAARPADAALLADLEAYADALAADLDAYWARRLAEAGVDYRRPGVVFYTEATPTPCGLELVPGATGAYYCPRNERIYVDGVDNVTAAEVFGRAWLSTLLGSMWGHHVQHLLGTFPADPGELAAAQGALKLQADCLAGGWTADADGRGLIEANAVDVAVYLLARLGEPAREVGPNRGHASSEQRVRAFLRGYDRGTEACFAPSSRRAATL